MGDQSGRLLGQKGLLHSSLFDPWIQYFLACMAIFNVLLVSRSLLCGSVGWHDSWDQTFDSFAGSFSLGSFDGAANNSKRFDG